MKNKLVSILIPVYNRESYIEETVQSALNQKYKNIEIIVVDNKSTDNTWQVLERLARKDERIKTFQNETNIGPVRNWKRCIDEASGVYGKVLFSDDLMEPNFIDLSINYLEDESIGFVFTGREIFWDNDKKLSNYVTIGSTDIYPSEKYITGVLFGKHYPNSPGCALFRLNDLKENLMINIPNKIGSDFAMHGIGADLLIFLITASRYENFVFINKKMVRFRAHETSITINSGSGKLLLMYAITKAYFLENYLKNDIDIINKFNGELKLLMMQYDSKIFGLDHISDFYMINENFHFSKVIYLKMFLKLVKKTIKTIIFKAQTNHS
jgi:glycosyltransferase involved in cell wall biosynthesis